MLSLFGMLSVGDWYYKGNAQGNVFSETNELISADTQTLYIDKVKVGGAAQTSAAVGFTFKPTDWFSFDGTYGGLKIYMLT
jgi:hypothetical protein